MNNSTQDIINRAHRLRSAAPPASPPQNGNEEVHEETPTEIVHVEDVDMTAIEREMLQDMGLHVDDAQVESEDSAEGQEYDEDTGLRSSATVSTSYDPNQEQEFYPEEEDEPETEQGEELMSPHLDTDNLTRFSGAEWFAECQKHSVVIAGIGGIGSYLAFLMARLNPNSLFIYDPDTVETVNLAGQLFGKSDVGRYKVDAVAHAVKEYSSYNSLFAYSTRYDNDSLKSDIMMCGFDNMEARRTYFRSWRENLQFVEDKSQCLFVDGRLSAEILQVFCIRGDDEYHKDDYMRHQLFEDSEVNIEAPCSYKQTAFMANMIAGIMVNCYVNHCAIQANNGSVRELPYFTEYEASSMYLRQEAL